jgi:hypothetical protein
MDYTTCLVKSRNEVCACPDAPATSHVAQVHVTRALLPLARVKVAQQEWSVHLGNFRGVSQVRLFVTQAVSLRAQTNSLRYIN